MNKYDIYTLLAIIINCPLVNFYYKCVHSLEENIEHKLYKIKITKIIKVKFKLLTSVWILDSVLRFIFINLLTIYKFFFTYYFNL